MPELLKTPFDGNAAFIVGDHSHAVSLATCLGAEMTNIGYGLKFKRIDSDEEFFVFKPAHINWVKK